MDERLWNPFLKAVIDLKIKYKKILQRTCSYEPDAIQINKTCVNRWLNELNNQKFKNLFSGITLWQYKNFVIAHYNDYYKAFDEFGNSVDYNVFFSLYNGLYMECRGVVVDVENEQLVLAPYRKFFNLNEKDITSLENVEKKIKTAKEVEFSDKLDGSMISASIYKNEVVVAGSSCNHPDKSIMVKESYKIIQNNENYLRLLNDYPDTTFIFEYIFPKLDLHIVRYTKNGLYLTGIRENKTGKELSYRETLDIAKKYDIPSTVKIETTLDTVLSQLDDKKASEAEGFVLNVDGFKVKIKYNDYCMVNKILFGKASMNHVIKSIHDKTTDDLLSKIPESHKDMILESINEINQMVTEIDTVVEEYQKQVQDLPIKEAMCWINKNVPKKYIPFVIAKYKKMEEYYLKTKGGHYRTYLELCELHKKD